MRTKLIRSLIFLIPLLMLLWAAWLVRQPMLRVMGYRWDTYTFEEWALLVNRGGLFNAYVDIEGTAINHPPVGVALLSAALRVWAGDPGELPPETHAVDLNPDYIHALKLPLALADLALVAVGYAFAYAAARRWRIAWAVGIGAALAFSPALLVDSAWWGQTDGLVTLFLVLTVIALRHRRHTLAWALYAIALLTKFQAAPLFPLLLILTYRRDGWRGVLRGGLVAGGIALLVLAPFVAGSGLSGTLRPYFGTVGQFPFVTSKAHNLWYWLLASSYNLEGEWFTMPLDTPIAGGVGIAFGAISARAVGYALFAACAAWIGARAWRRPEARDEFLLAGALHLAFFLVSTQMQGRYLLPAIILLIFACLSRPRLIPIVAVYSLTMTYNVLLLASHDTLIWQRVYDTFAPIPQHVYALVNVILGGMVLLLASPLDGRQQQADQHAVGDAADERVF